MLKVLLQQKNQDFIQFFRENMSANKILILCPNPDKADLIRTTFDAMGVSVESVTIAHFVKGFFSQLERKTGRVIDLKGKSELLYTLGAIWKKMDLGQDINEFKRSFNLLTEFRSFSTNEDILNTVLENYDEAISRGVVWMQKFIQQLDILDEHQSYIEMAKTLREENVENWDLPEGIVFFGFDFITGSQVDLVKTLSEKLDVMIPFYKEPYDKKSNFDWISWITESEDDVLDISENEKQQNIQDVYAYPKNYLSQSVDILNKRDSFNTIVLGTNKLEYNYIQELPLCNFAIKNRFDIFEQVFIEVSVDIENLIPIDGLETSKLLDEIKVGLGEALKEQQFRTVKVYLLFLDTISAWRDLSDENEYFSLFDFLLIKESVTLDLPRTNIASLISRKSGEVISVSEVERIRDDKSLFIISSNYQGMAGNNSNYTEKVETYLSSVGPIRRAEFDRHILKAKVLEYLEQNDVLLLAERGSFEHNAHLKELFEEVELNFLSALNYTNKNLGYSYHSSVSEPLTSVSATKLQSFIDCPRKYYLKYVERFSPNVKVQGALSPLEIGRIQHNVIERYFQKTHSQYSKKYHEECIKNTLSKQFDESSLEYNKYFVEVFAYTYEILNYLTALVQTKNAQLAFEVPFEFHRDGVKYSGSIDCFVTLPEGQFVLDFKRSNFNFSTLSSMLDIQQVQLWFYLNQMKNMKVLGEAIGFGYIDLSEMSQSTFMANDKELLYSIVLDDFDVKTKFIDEWSDHFEEYVQLEKNTVAKIKTEVDFLPAPRLEKVCHYCLNQAVCSRGLQ